MRDKGRNYFLRAAGFHFLPDRYEDRTEFVGLLLNRLESFKREDFHSFEEFEPIEGFFEFLKRALDLANETSIGFGVLGFTILCSDGCSTSKHLFP
jgi:hypothetical protein